MLKRVLGHSVERQVYIGDELPPQPLSADPHTNARLSGHQPWPLAGHGGETSQLAQNFIARFFPRLEICGIRLMVVNPLIKPCPPRRKGAVDEVDDEGKKAMTSGKGARHFSPRL
jgi:hypothetical protein